MPFPISLTQEQYEALVALARQATLTADGQVDANKARALDAFLVPIEQASGIMRYAVWIQWQETSAPLPPGTNFPEVWPPSMRSYLALVTRPIAKSDVQAVLTSKATSPMAVLVTKDPAGLVGWQDLDVFFK